MSNTQQDVIDEIKAASSMLHLIQTQLGELATADVSTRMERMWLMTIDAQLVILHSTIAYAANAHIFDDDPPLALARAVNGAAHDPAPTSSPPKYPRLRPTLGRVPSHDGQLMSKKEMLPGTTILRAEDDARYELGKPGRWSPMDPHCAGCADGSDDIFTSEIGDFAILTVPVAALESVTAERNAALALIEQIREEVDGDATAYDIHKLLLKVTT
ncbi:hypothetical protein [Cryobacterium sp. Y57]|uniref:hypothetical protein n=1 Tax=Cryobacterium sp. Y57 TaxID=2048287 RepID=UPI000CE52613|nr:hypothetical protein [Cryobacterium sp. Y57]